jgi:hypothetical protein
MANSGYYLPISGNITSISSRFPQPNFHRKFDESITGWRYERYLPSNAIPSQTGNNIQDRYLDFIIPPCDDLIDVEFVLCVSCTVLRGDNTKTNPIGSKDNVGIYYTAQNALQSLFSSVELFWNGVVVNEKTETYPISSFLHRLVSMSQIEKVTWARASGWYDFELKETDVYDAELLDDWQRKRWFGSSTVELMSKLDLDLSTCPFAILPKSELRLRLTRSSNTFFISCPDSGLKDSNLKLVLQSAELYVKKLTPVPSANLALEAALSGSVLHYPMERRVLKTHALLKGIKSYHCENVFGSYIPKRMVLALFSETALMGDYGLDPLTTAHAFCNNVSVTIDGITMYSVNLDPETNAFTQPYLVTMDAIGNANMELDFKSYGTRRFIICFDLSSNHNGDLAQPEQPLFRTGYLKLGMSFAKALENNLVLTLMGYFDTHIEVTGDRQVFTRFPL